MAALTSGKDFGKPDSNRGTSNNLSRRLLVDSSWNVQFGTSSSENSYFSLGISLDSSDDVYTTGNTEGSLYGLNAGSSDGWMSKYAGADGSFVWGVQFGTASHDDAVAIALDSSDDVILTGSTEGDLHGSNAGDKDIWISKRSGSDGSLIWGVQIGTTAEDYAVGVAVSSSDNVYAAGYTLGSLYATLQSNGNRDFWVAKYSGSDGTLMWGVQYGSNNPDMLNSVAVDSLGDVITVGITTGPLYALAAGDDDIWLNKLSGADGSLMWGVQEGNSLSNYVAGVAIDGNDDVITTGFTYGDLHGVSAGHRDITVAKYSGIDGAAIWAVQDGDTGPDYSRGIAVDNSGDVYLAGETYGSLYAANVGSLDKWISKRSGIDGAFIWGLQHGSVASDSGRGVIVDSGNDVYSVGHTSGSLYETNFGSSDIWMSKISFSPTGEPTGQPSDQPSGQPTSEPSGEPTGEPSGAPTSAPSISSEPTTSPNTILVTPASSASTSTTPGSTPTVTARSVLYARGIKNAARGASMPGGGGGGGGSKFTKVKSTKTYRSSRKKVRSGK